MHTDVIEKIVEAPKKTIYVDEFVEIEKNTSISENNENITLNLNETSKHKNITENIYDEIDYVRTDKKRLDDSRTVSILYLVYFIRIVLNIKTLYSVESIRIR